MAGFNFMKKGGLGGAKTLTGLNFEKRVDLHTLLSKIPGYRLKKQKRGLEFMSTLKID